jgi:hypothetical protein
MLDRGLQVVKRCAVYYTARLPLAGRPAKTPPGGKTGERSAKAAEVV